MDREVALITGGGRGIGRAVALAMAESGRNVVINYAGNAAKAEQTAQLCAEKGVETLVVRADVALPQDCERLVKETVEKFGRIDILVNNAGITRDNLMLRMDISDFDEVVSVNLRAPFLLMKLVAKVMMKKRYGRIVNMASVSGILGNAGQANYAASKAGLIGMTKTAARELASRNITVNAVAPGFIATDMTEAMDERTLGEMCENIPLKRVGSPEDVANTVRFFASKEAGYITGQVLCIDGGMCM